MNKFLLLTFLTLFATTVKAQLDLPERSYLNESLAPFYHGVASGDATSDKLIIWTRITTEAESANVKWRIATDSLFQNIADEGIFTTDGARDYTVKVDVQDLEENTWYFYEFEDEEGRLSQRGRTKTIPSSDISNFRAAVVSCSSYPHGFYNVYDRIAEKNDVHAVFHLGDYIYEYGLNEYGKHPDRIPDPEKPTVTLAEYRTRYSQYRLDTMLQKIHQQYPFYCVWDDHEFADNSWRDGANNHFPNKQGDWNSRKHAALQAYLEWIPIREIDLDNKFKIYRSIKVGDLAEIFFLDTRMIGRDYEKDPDGPNKNLLGPVQMEWLQQGLKNSTSKWKVLAQQVMMSPLTLAGLTLNSDQWDGYTFERKRLFDFVNENDIDNLVVLTGDIHTFWAYDLPFGKTPYNPEDRSGSAGVEFVTTAVSSPGFPIPGNQAPLIQQMNPYLRFLQLDKRGYITLDLNEERAQGDYYQVSTVNKPNTDILRRTGWYTLDGTNHLKRSSNEAIPDIENIALVPRWQRDTTNIPTGIKDKMGTVIGAYPNPFYTTIGLQYHLKKQDNMRMQVYDMSGKLIIDESLGLKSPGLHYDTIEATELPAGQYRITVTNGKQFIGRNVVKVE